MAKKKNVPQVRFAGYSDEWVKYQFGNILDKYEYPVATPHDGYERLGVRSHVKGTFHSYVAPGSELETAQMYRVAADKLLFNITFAWEHAVAITDETDAGKLVSHRFPQFTFVPEMDPKFFRYVVADDKFRYHLWLSSPGGAGRNRVLNIPEMLEYQTYLPQKAEQIRLADWFSNLDAVIVQHQSKLEKLRNLKSSMLEKMFPKDGADVPEVRFKEYSSAWKEYSFINITYPAGTRNRDNIQYESYSITNESGFVLQNEQFENGGTMKDADKRMYIIVEPNSFAYNPARINVGSIGYQYLNHNVIVSSLYEVFKTTDECNDEFLWYWFKTKAFSKMIEQLQEGGVRLYFYYDKLCMCSLRMPDVTEQARIAEYFKNMDKLIYECNRELEKLQSLKKALLEKMFV